MIRIKELTKAQQRVWRAARTYAKAELEYAEVEYAYRSTGDPVDMPRADKKRANAAGRLYAAIKNS